MGAIVSTRSRRGRERGASSAKAPPHSAVRRGSGMLDDSNTSSSNTASSNPFLRFENEITSGRRGAYDTWINLFTINSMSHYGGYG